MLKSMTGYGRCEETVNGRHITAELKSVNHKYFEFNSSNSLSNEKSLSKGFERLLNDLWIEHRII